VYISHVCLMPGSTHLSSHALSLNRSYDAHCWKQFPLQFSGHSDASNILTKFIHPQRLNTWLIWNLTLKWLATDELLVPHIVVHFRTSGVQTLGRRPAVLTVVSRHISQSPPNPTTVASFLIFSTSLFTNAPTVRRYWPFSSTDILFK
jgi:hypothetical protein